MSPLVRVRSVVESAGYAVSISKRPGRLFE